MNETPINVAVVDDDESFARSLERLFRASGLTASTYPSGEAFLARTSLAQPDCLVLDVQLGGMSGLDLQQHLRKVGDPAPIVFVTAHDSPTVRLQAEQAGCSAYFSKPVLGELLLAAIKKAVNSAAGNEC